MLSSQDVRVLTKYARQGTNHLVRVNSQDQEMYMWTAQEENYIYRKPRKILKQKKKKRASAMFFFNKVS